MRRALLAAAAILAAVLVQVTVLNNVPFPGGAGPDLVLVVVVAMALASGPRDGAIIGFAAGLALDIAPPASNLLGQSALVFCLVGYGCGRLRAVLERSAWLPLAGVAVGAAAGEVLYALVGLIFGDPDVTWQAVRQVLPAAVFYDLLISPFVLYAVAWLGGYARWGPETAGLLTGRELAAAGGGVLAGVGAASGAVRDTGAGRSPRLRAAAGHRTDGWIGGRRERPGQPGQPAGAWLDQRRPPRLRLRGGTAGSATASQPARPARPKTTVHLRLGTSRRRDGTIVARRPLAGAGPGTAFDGRTLNWAGRPARLRSGALSGGPSALGPGQPRKQRQPRLKLASKRGRDGPGSGGRFGVLRWPGRLARRRQMGRGSFATGPAVRAGTGGAGRGAAAPRFRSSGRARKPAAALRTSAPRFRRPRARWQRAGRKLGFGGSPGAGPGMRTRPWRRRFSRPGKGGWR
jgi:rod shape-determining protein MreD